MPTLTQRPLFDVSPAPPPAPGRTAAEFFAGIGLARIGLEQAGWEVVLANDLDPSKQRLYEGHFGPSTHYLLEDVHRLAERPECVPDVSLAHASFPCTDLSLAGARRGLDSGQSSAFWGFHQLLEAMHDRRPPLVLLENVTGLLNSHGGRDLHALLRSLNRLGYAVDALVLDAAHFVPQSRPRLFVIGKRRAPRDRDLRPDTLAPSPTRPAKLIEAIRAAGDIDWSIAQLPEPPPYGAVRLESVLDDVPLDSPQWWSRDRAEYLLSQMSARHRCAADAMIGGKRWSYGTVFRRVRHGRSMAELRTDGLAGCLRTPKGGSGRQILFQAGDGEHHSRLLNADECARLMGAPGYRVTCRLNEALFGFGDAVCVPAVTWIAQHVLNPALEAR
ncbi:Modification methylase HhaI [Pirellulimonas nuda]|uniref:DNA (cytosine-5-)-methyltransferase n=1 Tax=Pirellulimonas nuda TaxID=2528009 RepID=A0A518DAV1_9BACT|nr:DNA cytosine methyltransferase [Pirellulimonas nuda]QDU88610.1 Modification methylase HhaI [Pirellulimonas nuda]